MISQTLAWWKRNAAHLIYQNWGYVQRVSKALWKRDTLSFAEVLELRPKERSRQLQLKWHSAPGSVERRNRSRTHGSEGTGS
jgi:hypothetical protein